MLQLYFRSSSERTKLHNLPKNKYMDRNYKQQNVDVSSIVSAVVILAREYILMNNTNFLTVDISESTVHTTRI